MTTVKQANLTEGRHFNKRELFNDLFQVGNTQLKLATHSSAFASAFVSTFASAFMS